MELQDWPILKPLKSYFLKSVRVALVFGKTGNEALLLTRDDRVYGIGANYSGHLGFGDESPRTKLTEIPSLSGKGVKGFAYGGDSFVTGKHFVVAYLNNNELYHWGSIPCNETPLLKPNLFHKLDFKVEEVACGDSHCVVLCENGQVYTWGTNEKGQLGREVEELGINEHEVKKEDIDDKDVAVKCYQVGRVKGILDEAVVIQISCGAQFTVAVINDGRVISWGCNEKYQLGFSTIASFIALPTEIPTLKKTIRKVVCGRAHVVALCVDLSVEFWGNNVSMFSSGNSSRLLPTKLRPPKYSDVGASYLFDFVFTVDENKKVLILGQIKGQAVAKVAPSACNSVYQAFNQLVSVMPESLRVQNRRTLNDVLIHSFENQNYCDFVIEVEDKKFHVHKAILLMRSPYFETLFTGWFDSKMNVYSVEEKSPLVIEAYLKYIYTDTLDVNLDLALELLLLADKYCDHDFKVLCEKVILEKMTFINVVDIYPLIFKMKNVEKLNARCVELSAAQPNHLENMVNSDGYKHWDAETLQKFVPLYAKRRRLNN